MRFLLKLLVVSYCLYILYGIVPIESIKILIGGIGLLGVMLAVIIHSGRWIEKVFCGEDD